MQDPLPAICPVSSKFQDYVSQLSSRIYSLSTLLLEHTAQAEHITIATFKELYELNSRKPITDQTVFFTAAFQSCIRLCAEQKSHLISGSSREGKLQEDQAIKALWYGLRLPMPEISLILEISVPELKSRLRGLREQMAGLKDSSKPACMNTA